jgi:hypothetical protein
MLFSKVIWHPVVLSIKELTSGLYSYSKLVSLYGQDMISADRQLDWSAWHIVEG